MARGNGWMRWLTAAALVAGLGGCGDELSPLDPSPDPDPATAPDAHFDVTVDPSTGVVSGTATVRLRADVSPLRWLSWTLDQGLTARSATVNGRAVAIVDAVASPYRAMTVALPQPVTPGSVVELSLQYHGTTACEAPVQLWGTCDVVQGGMSRFGWSSIFPMIVLEDGTQARLPVTLVLRTPPDTKVVVSADPVSDQTEGGHRVTRWRLPQPTPGPLLNAVIGTFTTVPLTTSPRPTFLHHALGDDGWNARLTAWIPSVVEYVEAAFDRRLPPSEVHLVKWPDHFRDSGFASYGFVALRDFHEQSGDFLFEEAWVHELSHMWFGTAIVPTDAARSAVLTEGLVHYESWKYRLASASRDRDEYLAYRAREYGLMRRYQTPLASRTPVVVAAPQSAVGIEHGFFESFTWSYLKTTATLDYLDLLVGPDAYHEGLGTFHDRCLFRRCDLSDFRDAMETASGLDLQRFFDEWFLGSPSPVISLAFTRTPTQAGEVVEVVLETTSTAVTPLELWIELTDGRRLRERVDVRAPRTNVSIPVAGAVRTVRPNPRHQALATILPAVRLDVDFDGAVTPADRQHCAAIVGKAVAPRFPAFGGAAYTGIDLDFDPLCDLDGDASITPAEIDRFPPG